MKITHEFVNELHQSLARVANAHGFVVLVQPLVAHEWLENEFEFSFKLCEMTDKELNSECG